MGWFCARCIGGSKPGCPKHGLTVTWPTGIHRDPNCCGSPRGGSPAVNLYMLLGAYRTNDGGWACKAFVQLRWRLLNSRTWPFFLALIVTMKTRLVLRPSVIIGILDDHDHSYCLSHLLALPVLCITDTKNCRAPSFLSALQLWHSYPAGTVQFLIRGMVLQHLGRVPGIHLIRNCSLIFSNIV